MCCPTSCGVYPDGKSHNMFFRAIADMASDKNINTMQGYFIQRLSFVFFLITDKSGILSEFYANGAWMFFSMSLQYVYVYILLHR